MDEAVYILCAVTSAVIAVLLARAYRDNRSRLLLLSTLCFAGLAVNNAILVIDRIVVPHVDLSILRGIVAVAAMALLALGLIGEDSA